MAPPRDWPSGFASPEVVAAAPFELLPKAAPSESQTSNNPTPQPTSPWLSIRMPRPHSTDAPTSSIPRAAGERCDLPVEYRLARLSALAARASVASSSRASTSPRWRRHQRQGSCSPSFRAVQEGVLNVQEGGQRSKKRKFPCAIMPPFPLSRMALSPRIQLSGTCLRSPSVRHETSPSALTFITPLAEGQRVAGEIDLNVALEDIRDDSDSQENCTTDDAHGQENVSGDETIGQGTGTRDDPLGQESARKNVLVPDEKRRAIFEALLRRAKHGNLKGSETKEVSIQFSVPIRTVQRIWKKGKSYLDQGLGVDVSTEKNRCGRKKKVVDVSKLQDIPLSSRTTIDDVAKHLGVSKAKVQRMKK